MQQMTPPARTVLFRSKVGWITFTHTDSTVSRVLIGFPSRRSAFVKLVSLNCGPVAPNPMEQNWIQQFQSYADGSVADFSNLVIDESWMTDFQRKCVRACRKIPAGSTLAYGELAARIGSPKAARAVGTVMRSNRYPLIVPCHRVVAATGLGGFSAPTGVDLKKRLLALERDSKERCQSL